MKTQNHFYHPKALGAPPRHSDCCAAILPEILPDSMRAQRLFQIKIMSTAILERGTAAPPPRYSANRTRHHVDFFCDAPPAESVKLVGDFNGWDLAATPMQRMPDGTWTASLELHHGHHQYLFLVDGEPVIDPNANGTTRNDQNERVSLIAVS